MAGVGIANMCLRALELITLLSADKVNELRHATGVVK